MEKHRVKNKTHEKGYKSNPFDRRSKTTNTQKSRTRVRVEHVIGFMENFIGSMFFRKIGVKRAEASAGLMNLTYNVPKDTTKAAETGACL